MRVVALISGGKDSTFNMMQCISAGHEIVALANLMPYNNTEIDSYMYQSVGYEAIDLIAKAIDLPLFKKITYGTSKIKEKFYEPCENDEVEDLYFLLKEIQEIIQFDGVSVGAILSDYQRLRVENVCLRLNLTPLAYLWQRNQNELLDEIIQCEIDAILIKVATLGLDPKKHLGRTLSSLQSHLLAMHEKYGLNVCGEGGEYETLTLDCPLFKSRIIIEQSEIIIHQNDPIAPVGYLKLHKLSLEFKLPPLDLKSRLDRLPLKNSFDYVNNITIDDTDDDDDDNDDGSDIDNIENDNDIETNQLEDDDVRLKMEPTWAVSRSSSSSGNCLMISGIQSWIINNPAAAMEEAIKKMQNILQLNGHELTDICSLTMYINNMTLYSELNNCYIKMFNHIHSPPTRACVQIPISCPIQIDAISWKLNNDKTDNSSCSSDIDEPELERHTMHIQSISHWAPSNIGPYSQAIKIGEFIYLAGQIALIPGNMKLINGGIKMQCKLVIRHINRLLNGIDSNVNLRNVVQGVCYVTHPIYIKTAKKLWEAKTKNAIIEYVVVTGLPRNALIEWHVWAHKYNNQFEYEEKGKCIENYLISLYKRVNYECNVSAIICRIDQTDNTNNTRIFDKRIFSETLTYLFEKFNTDNGNNNMHTTDSVYYLKIFFNIRKLKNKELEDLVGILKNTSVNRKLVYDFVAVNELQCNKGVLSICAIHN